MRDRGGRRCVAKKAEEGSRGFMEWVLHKDGSLLVGCGKAGFNLSMAQVVRVEVDCR